MNNAEKLQRLSAEQLRTRFHALTGKTTQDHSRPSLIEKVTRAEAEHAAMERITTPSGVVRRGPGLRKARHDGRLPRPGTIIEREFENRKIRVTVLSDGFEWEGRKYTSLSTIARLATGTIWNGYLFFRLDPERAAG